MPDVADVIVQAFDPRRIILFGSVADGTDGPDSDIDLLVVLEWAPVADRRRLMVDVGWAGSAASRPASPLFA